MYRDSISGLTVSILSVGVRGSPALFLLFKLQGDMTLEFVNRGAVPGIGSSSSSESGSGVGLMSSRPVLEGRECRCGGMGESCEDDEEIGLPSIRTSASESPRSFRKGLRSISMRESRLLRPDSWVGVPSDGQGSGVEGGGVAGWVSGAGGGSGIGGVVGLSLTGVKSVLGGGGA